MQVLPGTPQGRAQGLLGDPGHAAVKEGSRTLAQALPQGALHGRHRLDRDHSGQRATSQLEHQIKCKTTAHVNFR